MKYTKSQRNFESGLTRYKSVLVKEKKKHEPSPRDTYGEGCTIYFGDWSRGSQMKGCDPYPKKKVCILQ